MAFLCSSSRTAEAATCVWKAGATANFNASTANWSCGAIPGSSDDVYFCSGSGSCPSSQAGSTASCNITSGFTVNSLSIYSTYSGTVTQGTGYMPIYVNNNFSQAGGTFAGGDWAIWISGNFSLTGGTFTSPSHRLQISGSFTKSGGTFNANNGWLWLDSQSSRTFTTGNATFNDVYLTDGLLYYYKLDETSGTTANTATIYTNTYSYGAGSQAPTQSTSSGPPVSFRNDAYLTFNRANSQYATMAAISLTQFTAADSYTLSMWVKPTDTSSSCQGVVTFGRDAVSNWYGLWLCSSGGLKYVAGSSTSNVFSNTSVTNAWHHVTIVQQGSGSGNRRYIYLDGVDDTNGTPTAVDSSGNGTICLGRGTTSEYFSGSIDDVRLYTRALSATEIAALAAGNQPASTVATQTLSGNLTATGQLVLDANLSAGSNSVTVGSNWQSFGGSFSHSGTITLNSTSSGKLIRTNQQTFNNLTFNGSGGAWSFEEANHTLNGTLTITNGTVTAPSGLLTVGGAFSKSGGTFTHNSGTVLLSSTSSQTFAPNSATFNNLVINDGLAGYYRLDENTGATTADSSGYGKTATLASSPSWTTTMPTLGYKNSSAISFAGTNSYLDIATPIIATNAAFTACSWVQFSSTSGYQTLVSVDGSSVSGFYVHKNGTNGKFDIEMRASDSTSATSYIATGTTSPGTGTWYHVCGVYTGSVDRIYVNGVQEGSDTTVSASWQATGHTIIGAGKYSGSRTDYVNGIQDDVRFYSRALTDREIYSLYLGYQPGTSSATQTMSGSMTVSGDLTIASGTLAQGSNSISLAGNWWNWGGLSTATYGGSGGTLYLTGTSTSNSIRSAGQIFPDITITGTGKWTLWDPLDIDQGDSATMTSGSMDISAYTLRAGDVNTGSGTLTTSSGTVVLTTNASKTLDIGSYNILRVEMPNESNLAAYWKLDELQGSTARDWSGGGHTGTLTNGAMWSTSVPSAPEFNNRGSLYLQSSKSQYIDLGTSVVATNAAYTACGWIKFNSISATEVIVSVNGSQVSGLQVYRDNASGKFAANMRSTDSTGAAYYGITGSTTPTTGVWYHACALYDGSYLHLYVNGAEEGTAVSVGATWNATGHGYIGANVYSGSLGNYPDGYIDDVRIYNTGLSSAQIKALYLGRYAGTGAPATFTLGTNLTVGSTFALDSGNLSTSSYTVNLANSDATKVSYVSGGTYTVGSATTNFKGGLTVRNEGKLALNTTSGVAAIGSGKTLTIDGTLDASTAGVSPSIQSVSGTYTFTVGSSSTATPTLNIDGLQVKNGAVDGMYINAVAGSSTTFTKFDNLAFSSGYSGSGGTFLRIYATALSLVSSGSTFTFSASKPDYAVKLAGNGTGDGETRAMFGNTLCPSSLCASSNKSDDDANNDGVGDTPASNGAVVQFLRGSPTDTAGTIEGFPTAAFDWNTFAYYSTYVAYRSFSGSQDRLFVRASSGAASYYWDLPTAAGHIVGTPRWTQISSTKYVYIGTTAGYVYKLVDNGSSLAMASSPWDTAYCYGGSPCSANDTITSPLGIDGTNVYWVGTDSSSNRKFFILTHGKSLTSASLAIPAAVTAAPAEATISSLDYMFAGMQGYLYKIKISDQSSTSWTQPATTSTINGRVTVLGSLAFLPDNRGHIYAVNTSSLATDWSYQDTGNHGGSCSDGGNCTIKNLYADYNYLDGSSQLMYGDQDGHVYSISKNGSGATVMTGYPVQPASGEAITTAPLYRSGILLVGTSSGSLFVINRKTTSSGTPATLYTYKLGSAVSSIGYNSNTNSSAGAYMIGTANGNLFFIDKVSDPDAYN